MTEFIALRPELYSFRKLDDGEDKKCKGIKMFVSLYNDRTIFYRMKNISQTSELPVRSCENRWVPL